MYDKERIGKIKDKTTLHTGTLPHRSIPEFDFQYLLTLMEFQQERIKNLESAFDSFMGYLKERKAESETILEKYHA